MTDQPHSTPTSELPRSPRVARLRTIITGPDNPTETLSVDPDLTQPMDVPADPGDTPPALSKPGGQADPPPDATATSAETHPRDGDGAGAGRPIAKPIVVRDPHGRFTPRPTIPPMSADLAGALIDADAEVWKVDTTLRTAGVLVFAVEFDDRVRHGGGAA